MEDASLCKPLPYGFARRSYLHPALNLSLSASDFS